VIFAPRIEGVYVAHLHLVICPVVNDGPLQPVKVPTMVTLQGIAETPNIQVNEFQLKVPKDYVHVLTL
jgi:hypothetical protein